MPKMYPYVGVRMSALINVAVNGQTGIDPSGINPETQRVLAGLIRSISSIPKSSLTKTEDLVTGTAPPTKSQKKKSPKKREPRDTFDVRVLSLRNPDHGRYELEAATGIKLRAHWVRGHWRNQWYPSLEDHRTIWIDGFVKGDASLGTVTGPKVYVAR